MIDENPRKEDFGPYLSRSGTTMIGHTRARKHHKCGYTVTEIQQRPTIVGYFISDPFYSFRKTRNMVVGITCYHYLPQDTPVLSPTKTMMVADKKNNSVPEEKGIMRKMMTSM